MQMLSLGFAAATLATASASGHLPLPLTSTVSGIGSKSTTSTMVPPLNDTSCHASAHIQEILSLSELPLDRLLKVKLAMHPYTREANLDHRQGEALPQAEALRSRMRYRDRPPPGPPPIGSSPSIKRYEDSGGLLGSNGKQSKLATGFQLAITVLSFLAFGAYLISLVVAIVRNNNTSTTSATTQQPFVLVPASAGRRRRRRRAAVEPPWVPPPLPEPDSMFSALTTLARAYAKFEGHELNG